MPKKFTGENSKSAVARARKEAVRQEKLMQKQKEIEDAYWKDDDKHVIKKQQRKVQRYKYVDCHKMRTDTNTLYVLIILLHRMTKIRKGRNSWRRNRQPKNYWKKR